MKEMKEATIIVGTAYRGMPHTEPKRPRFCGNYLENLAGSALSTLPCNSRSFPHLHGRLNPFEPLQYSGFFAEGYLYDTEDGRKQENTAWTFGVVTGFPSVASGQTLTWNGTMAGMKGSRAERQLGDPYVERDFEPVQGDAAITAHNDNGDLKFNVALTDIFYLNSGESGLIPDLVWASFPART